MGPGSSSLRSVGRDDDGAGEMAGKPEGMKAPAERRGTVKKVAMEPGSSLAVDELIMEFE